MSQEHRIELVENDVCTVSMAGNCGRYFMWQKGLTEQTGSKDGIYFEYNDQINGGYNTASHCVVESTGLRVTLVSTETIFLGFPKNFSQLNELKAALKKVYAEREDALEFSI
ncbi:hypothetical protein [Microbulbifer sp. YPW1]|uniref:hypothetical protein n=1 Tax=Microbulbifer sp. YPW1 TaxID=2745199 RepID=UPI00159831B9|nr:hypothetical protein [Microbulbifer sp. YPW1]QKX17756.1 hypothetical protein HUW35_12660 [Microbulbifer sp. YPW1]